MFRNLCYVYKEQGLHIEDLKDIYWLHVEIFMCCLQRTRIAHERFERHLLVACLDIYVMLTKTSIKSSTSSPRLDELAKAGLSIKVGQETTKPIQSCQGGGPMQGQLISPPPPPCQYSKDTISSCDPMHFANSASILF